MNTERSDVIGEIIDYQVHFDSIYVAGIPQLLNNEGAFLSFVTVLSAIEALAGLYAPKKATGERFKEFVSRYFPPELRTESERLWKFRNAMVDSFNPGPFALTHHASRAHLTSDFGLLTLNAEDFYAALLTASRAYFSEVMQSLELQNCFLIRVKATDGGAPQIAQVDKVRVTPNNAIEPTP